MIDPVNITNYYLNQNQLEEVLLFWICAAGKNAKTSARNLDRVLNHLYKCTDKNIPFSAILAYRGDLAELMKSYGIGCYNHKARSFLELAKSGLDLKTCTADELEEIHGIGMKTSRCFIIHSRENCNYAGLDTHILSYLNDLGYDVPRSTPSTKKKYIEIESIFLKLAKKSKKSLAKFDLDIWRKYSGNKV